MGAMNGYYSGVKDLKNYTYPRVKASKITMEQDPIGKTEKGDSHLDGKRRTYVKVAQTKNAVYWETEDGMEIQVIYLNKDIFCDCNRHQQANFDLTSRFYK